MLRSRIDNRPNSSVTDFRRQLSTLQSTSSPSRGGMRTIGRPLAQSPLQRPAAAGRPGQPAHAHHRQASLHSGVTSAPAARTSRAIEARSQPQFRSHGDPTGEHHRQTHMDRQVSASREQRPADPRGDVRRRRTNVLFLLVISTACTLFLAATTSSTVMLYVFALCFLALCGYVYLLAQLRQREASGWTDDWINRY
jgi:hypothetical protein